MNGATELPPPKISNAPISSNTSTIGVIHHALRCHKNPNKSFRKSIFHCLPYKDSKISSKFSSFIFKSTGLTGIMALISSKGGFLASPFTLINLWKKRNCCKSIQSKRLAEFACKSYQIVLSFAVRFGETLILPPQCFLIIFCTIPPSHGGRLLYT